MKIIGERINSTRLQIKKALDENDINFLLKEAQKQVVSGADYIDVNCAAAMEKEADKLKEIITVIREELDCGISIDTPDTELTKAILGSMNIGKPFVNSITAETDRIKELPVILNQKDSYVITLAMDDNGMPDDLEDRLRVSEFIISYAKDNNIALDNIYIDLLVKPVSTEPKQASYFLEAVKALSDKGINTIGGLSNVSFGLPKRALLNAVFIKLVIDAGISGLIIDPTEALTSKVLSKEELPKEQFVLAKEVLLGQDDYASNYIKAFREGRLEF